MHQAFWMPHLLYLAEALTRGGTEPRSTVRFFHTTCISSVLPAEHPANLQPSALHHIRSKICIPRKLYCTPSLVAFCYLRHYIHLLQVTTPVSSVSLAIVDLNGLPEEVVCLNDPIKFQAAIRTCIQFFEECTDLCTCPYFLPPPLRSLLRTTIILAVMSLYACFPCIRVFLLFFMYSCVLTVYLYTLALPFLCV